MRYEKVREEYDKDDEKLKTLTDEYEVIAGKLEEEFLTKDKEKEYRDMLELINRIAEYIFRDTEKVKKGVGAVMGGRILELESDKLIKKGEKRGKKIGEMKKAKETAISLSTMGLSAEKIAQAVSVNLELVQEWLMAGKDKA